MHRRGSTQQSRSQEQYWPLHASVPCREQGGSGGTHVGKRISACTQEAAPQATWRPPTVVKPSASLPRVRAREPRGPTDVWRPWVGLRTSVPGPLAGPLVFSLFCVVSAPSRPVQARFTCLRSGFSHPPPRGHRARRVTSPGGSVGPWKEGENLHSPKFPPPVNRSHPPHFK
jgi:hypothetical protein